MRRMRPLATLAIVLVATMTMGQESETGKADALLAAGDWSAAADAYQTVIEGNASHGDAWYGLGQARRGAADHVGAIAAFEKALALGINEQRSIFEISRCHAARDHHDEALSWLKRLAETGSTARLQVANAAEFASMRADPRFNAALDALRPCRSAAFRQFDFWVGDWSVKNRNNPDRPPSHNRISLIDGGCALLEQYDTPSGYTGTSISFWDAPNERWVQTWMDNQGAAIHHFGGIADGKMVLVDEPGEGQPLNRTTWTPQEDGQVRQHWELSRDGGASWTTIFDGIYTRTTD